MQASQAGQAGSTPVYRFVFFSWRFREFRFLVPCFFCLNGRGKFADPADNQSMTNKIRPKVAGAFNSFSEKFFRSAQYLDGSVLDLQREDDLLQKKVYEKEKDYKKSIITAYSRFMNPFRALGKKSREAQEISEDEENLLKAYNLFKTVKNANAEIGDGSTFISVSEIKSPLTEKLRYTSGGDFIYLQCWLIYEQGIRDYVPCIEEKEEHLGTFYTLDFVPFRSFNFSWQEREVIAAIEEAFHPQD